jgi:hypothetical protein
MNSSKPLFVTYMTDLGGTSLGKSYEKILKNECNFYELDLVKLQLHTNKIKFYIVYFKLVRELRKTVKTTIQKGGKVIFQNLKPALFTFGIWNNTNGIIISDFSHTLFQWFKDKTYKKDFRYYSQKFLYRKLYKVIALTDNLYMNLHQVYGVSKSRINRVSLPLDFEYYYQIPQKTNKIPKVLFVGGNFNTKGGNYLLDNWETSLKDKCELIIITKDKIKKRKGITVYNNLSKGDYLHQKLFKQSDVFVLPTTRDAFPVVLGEAGACRQ